MLKAEENSGDVEEGQIIVVFGAILEKAWRTSPESHVESASTQASLKRIKRPVRLRFKRFKVPIFSILSNLNLILDQSYPHVELLRIQPFSRRECPKL